MTEKECILKCRDAFRKYQYIYENKFVDLRQDSIYYETIMEKVKRNRELADMCDQVLKQEPKSVEFYETENRQACEYLERLLVSKITPHNKEWKPMTGDLIGLITQLDNMLTGLDWKPTESPTEYSKTTAHINSNLIDIYSYHPIYLEKDQLVVHIQTSQYAIEITPITTLIDNPKFSGLQYPTCKCGKFYPSEFLMNKPTPCNNCGPHIPNKIRMLK